MTQLETVVVTATRREESLQKVPVAVSVISGKELDKQQRNSLETLVHKYRVLTFGQEHPIRILLYLFAVLELLLHRVLNLLSQQ